MAVPGLLYSPQTASTEEVAAASEELAGLAETLDEIVRKFDISAGKRG